MTNHWSDIDNASLVLVFGANPAENHPACFAHINAARFGTKQAKLVVIDPRQTRTARQCDPSRGDFYVRIRPGTNIAFINGVLRWIINSASTYDATIAANMLAWHNGTSPASVSTGRTFADDGGTTRTLSATELIGAKYDGVATTAFGTTSTTAGYPKYCDTRFKVNTAGNDYQRGVLTTASGYSFTGFPVVAANVDDPDCVYQQMKAHVEPYDLATVADICGCTQTDIVNVAKILLEHSRFKSSDFALGATDPNATGAAGATPQAAGYRATTILYAMGQTQHTTGSQNIKGLAELQTLMGNMGRPGGGINALRGIHNVQGSTDMGNLFDSIPAYSANPGEGEHYSHYLDALFGNRMELHGTNTGAKDYTVLANLGLQQRGFANMTQEWFGNGSVPGAEIEKLYDLWPKGNGYQHIDAIRKMGLTDTDPARIKAAVVWGQNPCVTEPNQTKVREGFKNLDTLVVVDMFDTETASCDRRSDGWTYLIPACAHPEEAGSVTNSGRWLQWRERGCAPKGNSKADLELLLRFAKALDTANAFTHITGVWGTLTTPITGNVFDVLYGKYGWTPGSGSFEALSTTTEMWAVGAAAPADRLVYGSEVVAEKIYKEMCRPLNYLGNDNTAADFSTTTGGTMWIYSGAGTGGSAADASGQAGYNNGTNWSGNVMPAVTSAGNTVTWQVHNRAKSRNKAVKGNDTNGANNYPRWGWAWLLNRRVFYNNGEVAGDQVDTFVSPGLVSCLFTVNDSTTLLADWSLVYRKYKTFNDAPNVTVLTNSAVNAASPHWLVAPTGDPLTGGKTLAGRFPGHTEPYESPRPDLQAKWGKNLGKSSAALIPSDTTVGDVATYPLVLTTIRAVEHFQGGPITRNNPYNAEAEPEPWIEINPVDARKYGISDGDLVNVVTARSNSTTEQQGRTAGAAGFAKGFRARVDSGIVANQRVAPGVVAIPWHWGDRGLSTGSRANDLCIDSYDANTMIPEYKACLCRVESIGR